MASETGFLLSYVKYGDDDAVLQCFTKENGFQSFFAKGIFQKKNKKKAYLLPLNELCISLNPLGKNRTMPVITGLDLVENPDFYTNIKANTMVFFLADFLKVTLRNEQANSLIYDEILFLLNEIEKANYSAHLIFLMRFLQIGGVQPLLSSEYYLNPETGKFEGNCSHKLFTFEISTFWKEVLESKTPYEIRVPSKIRKQLLESLLLYYHYHFSNFKTPTSLEIVQEIL